MRTVILIGLSAIQALLIVKADDCPKGFYGPRCWRRCKEQSHCLDNDCVLLPSGRALNCSRGCRPGWRGLSCNTNCKHPCIECERYTGECVGACRDGYHGDRCYKNCPQGCVSCERVSGSCLNCYQGFYGAHCSIPCPSECVECDVKSGECLNRLSDDASGYQLFGYRSELGYQPGRDISGSRPNHTNRSMTASPAYQIPLVVLLLLILLILIICGLAISTLLLYTRRWHNARLNIPGSSSGLSLLKHECASFDTAQANSKNSISVGV